jgi:hypothetical protein
VMVSHAAEILQNPDMTGIDSTGFAHSMFTEHDGNSYLIDSTSLGVEWGPNWKIVTVIPESDLLAGVRQVQSRMIYWGIAVLVVSGLAGLLLSGDLQRRSQCPVHRSRWTRILRSGEGSRLDVSGTQGAP